MKTINKFFLLLGSLALTAGMTGCEDTRGEHLDEYASRIYFRDGGNQTISLYRVGENTVYKVPVCKGGSDLSYTAEATVAAVDQAQLDIYNMNNFTNYKQIPSSCFKFLTDTKLHFAAEDTYKVVEVELATDDISFLQEADPEHEYIFALQVYSDRQVSPDINLMILKPEIEVPVVSLAAVSEKKSISFTPTDEATQEVKGEIVLGMDNRWNFTCTLGVRDQEWLDAYNAEHDENYVLMPDNVYELSGSVIEFKEGSNTAGFTVKIKRENMGNFTKYILPLYLADCSKKNDAELNVFDLSDEDFLIDAVYTPDPEPITLTEAMLSTQYTLDDDGQGIPALVDGKDNTWWHSLWSGERPAGDKIFGVYIDVTLETPVTGVQFRYQTRPGNNNGVPQIIRIGASEDGVNWRMIKEVSEGLPTAAGAWSEYLPIGIARTPCKHFRFGVAYSAGGDCCTDPPSFTALGELQLKGI